MYISCIVFCPLQKAARVPSQVTGLSLSKAVLSRLPVLWATWTIPQSDEPISQYELQYRIHGTTSWGSQRIISPPQNSTFLTRLTAGTEYAVRVRAVSAVGAGNWSATKTERTYMSEFFPMILQPSGAYMFLNYHNFYLSWLNTYILFCNKLQIHFVHLFNKKRNVYCILFMHGNFVSMQ